MQRKGYVLTLDAFLAAMVFLALTSTALNLQNQEMKWEGLQGQQLGHDILDVLDSRNALEGKDSNTIARYVQDIVPITDNWRLKIEEFRLQGTAFQLHQTFNYGNWVDSMEGKTVVKTRRLFVTFDKDKIRGYHNAELELWVK